MSGRIFAWQGISPSIAIFCFRVLVGTSLFVVHGLGKLSHMQSGQEPFPDPFGWGPTFSLSFALLATLLCPVLIILGFATRPALLITLSVTLTGLLVVHLHDPLAVMDTPWLYSISLMLLLVMGPGKYSLDYVISKKI